MATTNSTLPNTQGESTLVIDRDTASKFNPLIGICLKETLQRCERISSDLGYVVSGANQVGVEMDMSEWYLMSQVVSAALHFEINVIEQGAQS